LGDQATLLAREAERLRKIGPDAKIEVNYQLTTGSPLVRGMATITQFVGAIVSAAGHATIARLAEEQQKGDGAPDAPHPRRSKR